MSGPLLAYVAAGDLAVQVERRRRGWPAGPLLVVRGLAGGRQVVEAVSDEARALGVAPGQTLRQAEHRCPQALVVAADPAAYAAAFERLLAALGACSPTVQPDRATFSAELDASGLELLFGPPERLAAELARRAGRVGLRARVGLGPNRLVARLAAGLAAAGGWLVVAPSRVAAFLAALPIAALPLEAESRERLELLGVERFGQLLALPRAQLARQIGPDALALVRAAEASDERLAPHRPTEWLRAEVAVDGPLETRQQLAALLAPLADVLAARLAERYLGAGLVRPRLSWSGGYRQERQARLPGRTAAPARLLEAALDCLPTQPAHSDDRPDWVELGVGDLGRLGARQDGLFERQRLRRLQAARAVEALATRFPGQLLASGLARSAR